MSEESVDILPATSMQSAPLTFHKRERLRHRSAVTTLFDDGRSEYAYPLRMFYIVLTADQTERMFHGHIPHDVDALQMMITVPKKKFKHAVDRVWLRRRVREAYRLNRLPLRDFLHVENEKEPAKARYMFLAFIYVGSEKREYASIEKKMIKLLGKAKDLLGSENDRETTEGADEAGALGQESNEKASNETV